MEANSVKGICIVLLFVDTLLFGWPPYLLVRGGVQSPRSVRIRSIVISYLTCFAGGVFLGACLLHLLAEGREDMTDYFEEVGIDTDFPVYEAIVAGGFFLIALVEQLAHRLLHDSHQGHHKDRHEQDSGDGKGTGTVIANGSVTGGSFQRRSKSKANKAAGLDNPAYSLRPLSSADDVAKDERNGTPDKDPVMDGEIERVSQVNSNDVPSGDNTAGNRRKLMNGKGQDDMSEMASHSEHEVSFSEITTEVQEKQAATEQENPHEHTEEMVQILQVMEANPLRAFLLLGALSFHTVFDGLAVGLQSDGTNVWEMFTAICIHKTLVALCLGTELFLVFKSKPVRAFIWIFVFSLISPIGVGIGMILTSGNIDTLAESLVSWMLQAVATGTFLYIALFEILHEELTVKGNALKIFVTMLGFGGMAVAKAFDKD